MHRRHFTRTGLAGLALLAAPTVRAQADYPNRTVRILVPFAAGGPADVFARALAPRLQQELGQAFVVENRAGGGSVIGTDVAAKSLPDGYTLLMMSNTHVVNETLLPNKPFALMRDFVPVAPVNTADLVLAVHPSVPASNMTELLALARSRPGRLNYASSGPGTPYHMAGELLKASARVHITHIPYRSSSGARTDLLGGQVEMMLDSIPTMLPHVQAGKVRALATTGAQRSPLLPDVPTMIESGLKGYLATAWIGLMAPRGTPPPVVEKLNASVGHILASRAVQDDWAKQGASPVVMKPAQFGAYLNSEIAKWGAIVKTADLKPYQ